MTHEELKKSLQSPVGTTGSGYCPECLENTPQTLVLYDPDEPFMQRAN